MIGARKSEAAAEAEDQRLQEYALHLIQERDVIAAVTKETGLRMIRLRSVATGTDGRLTIVAMARFGKVAAAMAAEVVAMVTVMRDAALATASLHVTTNNDLDQQASTILATGPSVIVANLPMGTSSNQKSLADSLGLEEIGSL